MEGKEYKMLERAIVELDSRISAYEKRGMLCSDEALKKRDAERVELFKFLRKEVGGVIPQHTVISDGKFYCPSCGVEIGALYPAADEKNIPINFCPCCMQAFEGRI